MMQPIDRLVWLLMILIVLCIPPAIYFAEVDLHIAQRFYIVGEGFPLSRDTIFATIHDSVRPLTIVISAMLLIILLLHYFKPSLTPKAFTKSITIYLLLALIMGPGLVVNSLFKDQWGRARPHQVEQFGGEKQFTPPILIADQCERNCSFVSGDPSVGFYFLAFALAFPAWRLFFLCLTFGLGGLFGVTRIVQGAHFFTDVVFSMLFTFLVCAALYKGCLRCQRNIG